MHHDFKRNMRHKLSTISALVIVIIFMAINPTTTNAQDNQSSFLKKWLTIVKIPAYEMDSSSNERNTSSDSNKETSFDDETLKLISWVNQERMEAGLTKLEVDSVLMRLAKEKGLDMVRFNYFGHYSERLGTVYNQLDGEKQIYQSAAENLIEASNCRRAFKSLLASPAHRSNILNPHFKRIGIGVVKGGPFGETIVQIFIG